MALNPLVVEEDRSIELEEGLSIRDLMNLGEATFSVKSSEMGEGSNFEAAEDVFDPDFLLSNVNMETLNLDDDHSGMPFESIKEKMTDVTPTGSVKKRVLKEGIGEIIPQDAHVTCHYNAYFEYNEVPFDSTTLRGKAMEVQLGEGATGLVPILGFSIALASMRDREKSEFIFQPSVAYGKLGCPPRIPPNSEMLFIIEVMFWKLGSEAAVARALSKKEMLDWEGCKSAFKALNKEGIALYNERRFKDCKTRLEKAKRLVEECHLKNDAEEEEQKHYMFKVCLNLAMAFNQMTGSSTFAPSAIINAKEALRIQPGNPKAHLQWGKALITLGELDRARDHLLRAKRKLPSDPAVTEAWEKLERKKKQENEEERTLWKKALNNTEKITEEKEPELSPEAKETFELLQKFALDPSSTSLTLPAGITPKEREELKGFAEKLNLTYTMRTKSILITKC